MTSEQEGTTLELSISDHVSASEDQRLLVQFVEEALPIIAPRSSDRLRELADALDRGTSAEARAAIEKMARDDPELGKLFERRVPSAQFWIFVGVLLQLVQTMLQIVALAITLSTSEPQVTVMKINERIVIQISASPRDEPERSDR